MNKGLVIKSTGSWYDVLHNGEIIRCKIKGKFRIKGIRTTNPITVGDWVDFNILDNQNIGLIYKIHKRKNYIIRKSINLSHEAHIIAANIDQAFIIATLAQPVVYTVFIDRFLATAEAYNVDAKLIFNKMDIYDEKMLEKIDALIEIYTKAGYACFKTSALKHTGIEELRRLMKDKISLVAGQSGVGKSTLLNAIDPDLELRTAGLSDYHKKGKHTTTFSEMFELSTGGMVIDTPGIKGFGMINMKDDPVSHYFPEMFELISQCQYSNCTHTHEPKCAVKDAIAKGEIAKSRYNSYLSILYDDENKYRTKF